MPTIIPIGIGLAPNDNLGDQVRTAFDKCNQNFNALNTSIPTGSSTLQIYAKASQVMTKGQPVYISTATGTNIIISISSNTTEMLSSKTLGLLVQNLGVNGQGYVITEGILTGLNTSTASDGDPVWLGANGTLVYGILNKPVSPAHLVFIGYVTRAHGVNGEIYVKVQNGFELSELHDVKITSPVMGDTMFYNSVMGYWQNVTAPYLIGGSYVKFIARNLQSNTTGGTTALTMLSYSTIPANTLISSDFLRMELYMHKINYNGTGNMSLWLNTSLTLSGATQIAIRSIGINISAETITRGYYIVSNTLRGYFFNNSSPDGMEAMGTSDYSSTPYNVGTTYYVMACMQVTNINDLLSFNALKITT